MFSRACTLPVRKRLTFVPLACVLALLAGCAGIVSNQPSQPPPAPAISVSVSPTAQSLQAGTGTQTFTATLQNDSQNKGVTWSLSGAGCSGATCGSLSNATPASVNFAAPPSVPNPASMTLIATSVADSGKTSSATITITAPITVSLVPGSATLNVGKTQQFNATVQNDAQNQGVAWKVNGAAGGDATHGTISSSGLYTAPSAVPAPSSVTVAAVSIADSSRSASSSVTILPAVSLSIAPANPSLQVGTAQKLTQRRNTRIVGAGPARAGEAFAIMRHGPQLVNTEGPTVPAQAHLRIEDRTARRQLHEQAEERNHGSRHD